MQFHYQLKNSSTDGSEVSGMLQLIFYFLSFNVYIIMQVCFPVLLEYDPYSFVLFIIIDCWFALIYFHLHISD